MREKKKKSTVSDSVCDHKVLGREDVHQAGGIVLGREGGDRSKEEGWRGRAVHARSSEWVRGGGFERGEDDRKI